MNKYHDFILLNLDIDPSAGHLCITLRGPEGEVLIRVHQWLDLFVTNNAPWGRSDQVFELSADQTDGLWSLAVTLQSGDIIRAIGKRIEFT